MPLHWHGATGISEHVAELIKFWCLLQEPLKASGEFVLYCSDLPWASDVPCFRHRSILAGVCDGVGWLCSKKQWGKKHPCFWIKRAFLILPSSYIHNTHFFPSFPYVCLFMEGQVPPLSSFLPGGPQQIYFLSPWLALCSLHCISSSLLAGQGSQDTFNKGQAPAPLWIVITNPQKSQGSWKMVCPLPGHLNRAVSCACAVSGTPTSSWRLGLYPLARIYGHHLAWLVHQKLP